MAEGTIHYGINPPYCIHTVTRLGEIGIYWNSEQMVGGTIHYGINPPYCIPLLGWVRLGSSGTASRWPGPMAGRAPYTMESTHPTVYFY